MTTDQQPPPTTTSEPAPTTATPPSEPAAPATRPTARTRTSGAWTAVIAGVIVLILLLIFILENTQRVKVNFLGAHGHLSLGVALLLAAVAGAVIVGIVAMARIVQLRTRARRAANAPAV